MRRREKLLSFGQQGNKVGTIWAQRMVKNVKKQHILGKEKRLRTTLESLKTLDTRASRKTGRKTELPI